MNKINYLTHFTKLDNCINIIKSNYLLTTTERIESKVKYQGVASMDENKWTENDYGDEFPGVFMDYITENDVHNSIRYWGDIMLVFSNKLLNQNNYHINIIDNDGYISENLTFFKFNIDKMPNQKDVIDFYKNMYMDYPGNEIVFHDKIHINSLCEIWVNNKENYNKLIKQIPNKYIDLVKIKRKYPKSVKCPNKIKIDTESLPFLLSLDFMKSGKFKAYYPYKNKTKSSKTFFKKMCYLANITDKEIQKHDLTDPKKLNNYLIKNKLYSYFHKNRDKQNLSVLY